MRFNFSFKDFLNWAIPLILVGFVLYTQGPIIYENFQNQGKTFPQTRFLHLKTQTEIQLPNAKRNLLIFWASWCGPCKLEMERIKKSIESGKIPGEQVYAINPYESVSKVQAFLQKNSYPFQFVKPLSPIRDVEVKATPTFVWLDGKMIRKMSTGIHLVGIYLLETFL